VITSVANNPVSHDLAWNWLSTNWEHIADYFDAKNSMKIGNVIKSCTETLNKFSELESLNKFFKDHLDSLGTAISGTKAAIETVKANIEWVSKGAKQVSISSTFYVHLFLRKCFAQLFSYYSLAL